MKPFDFVREAGGSYGGTNKYVVIFGANQSLRTPVAE